MKPTTKSKKPSRVGMSALRVNGKSKKKSLTPLPKKRTQAALDQWFADNAAEVTRLASENCRRLTGKDKF